MCPHLGLNRYKSEPDRIGTGHSHHIYKNLKSVASSPCLTGSLADSPTSSHAQFLAGLHRAHLVTGRLHPLPACAVTASPQSTLIKLSMEKVILGIPGPWADNNCEKCDHYTTKIGGLPDWPFPKSSLPPGILLCSACESNSSLVIQVYAPITNSTIKIEERTIYVFCCMSLKCGSYSAIRVQKSDAVSHEVVTSSASVDAAISNYLQLNDKKSHGLEDDEEDIVDGDVFDLEKLQMAFSQASITSPGSTQKKTANKSKANKKCLAENPELGDVDSYSLALPCFYTYDEVEKSLNQSSSSIKEKQDEKYDHPQEEVWEGESYEYDRALSADRTYLKFKKRLDAYPLQCFRYAYGGKPLLASRELADVGTCDACGGSRHFEMQLMSPLLYFLQGVATGHEKELLGSWNWMTLLLYTCSKSCSKVSGSGGWTIAKEAVIAQDEKLPTLE